MPTQYGLVTFKPQVNDMDLLDEFKILFQPTLDRCDRFLMSLEKPNTPEAHLHIIFSYENKDSDPGKVKQKLKSVSLKKFYARIKNENRLTIIDPNFNIQCLNAKAVKATQDDYLSALGYVAKENVLSSKGYTEDFVTSAVKFHFIKSRNDASKKPKKSWTVLNSKTFHVYVEDFCEKHDILPNSPFLLESMVENGIEVNDLPVGKRNSFVASINLKKHKEEPFLTPAEVGVYKSVVSSGDLNEVRDHIKYQNEIINYYKHLLRENNIEFEQNPLIQMFVDKCYL